MTPVRKLLFSILVITFLILFLLQNNYISTPLFVLITSGMLSIVGERESAHGKLEARTALRYVPCVLHKLL